MVIEDSKKSVSEGLRCSIVSDFLQPVNFSPSGSSVHGILQARILEWVAIRFSRGSNPGLLHCREILYHLSHQGSLIEIRPTVDSEELGHVK